MQIKNQIAAIVMMMVMCVMMIHNAIPHVHHNHEQIAKETHSHSGHSSENSHHHSHSDISKELSKKTENNNGIFDFGDHEHTFHLHFFEDYLLSNNYKSKVEKQFTLLSHNSIIINNTALSTSRLDKHILRIFRFPESPPSYSFSLRGPPILG